MFDVLLHASTDAASTADYGLLGYLSFAIIVIWGLTTGLTVMTGRRLIRPKTIRECPNGHGESEDPAHQYCNYCGAEGDVEERASIVDALRARLGGGER